MKKFLRTLLLKLLGILDVDIIELEDHLELMSSFQRISNEATTLKNKALLDLQTIKNDLSNVEVAYNALSVKYANDVARFADCVPTLKALVSGVERIVERHGPMIELDRAKAELSKHESPS